MKKKILTFIAGAALVVQACSRPNDGSRNITDTTNKGGPDSTEIKSLAGGDTRDTSFANKAAISGLAEVKLGELALSKTTNADIKHFADMMVNDHSKANSELKAIAQSKSVMLPTELDQEHKNKEQELSRLSGKEFDKKYADAMVEGHEKTLSLMNDEAKNGYDSEFKAFASKTAPVVDSHLQAIRKIRSGIK